MAVIAVVLTGCQWAPLDTHNGHPMNWQCGSISYTVVGGPAWLSSMTDQVVGEAQGFTGRQMVKSTFGNVLVLWTEPTGVPGAQAETYVSSQDGAYYNSAIMRVSPRLETQRPTTEGRLAVLRHEFGHVFGLAHVNDSSEVMHPSAPPVYWGSGTVQGLGELGRCL